MNADVNYMKEKVKESQSQSRNVTPSLDTPSGARLGASQRHTTTARARAEGREEKARDGIRVAEGELRGVRDGLQVAQDDLLVARDGL